MMLRDITTGLRSSAIAIAALGAMAAPAFAAQEQPQKKIACIGNSITFGYLLPDPATQSYPSVPVSYTHLTLPTIRLVLI